MPLILHFDAFTIVNAMHIYGVTKQQLNLRRERTRNNIMHLLATVCISLKLLPVTRSPAGRAWVNMNY